MALRSRVVVASLLLATIAVGSSAAERVGEVEASRGEAVQAGRVVYIDPRQSKVIEITLDGQKTWEFSIPHDVVGPGDLNMGADIEWIPQTDHFLFVVPLRGVFEVDRAKKIVWSYKTRSISHDADRLPNGNTVFVNGWDRVDDATVTEVDANGAVVFQWFARDHLDANERQEIVDEKTYSFTHANAVQRLADGRTLISLRNFHRFVIVRTGKIVKQVRRAGRVHDPVAVDDVFYFAMHRRVAHDLVRVNRDGTRTPLLRDKGRKWQVLRTVEILRNGNILITGGEHIGQIDAEGNLVWSIRLDGFVASKEAARGQRGQRAGSLLYKAAWVYK